MDAGGRRGGRRTDLVPQRGRQRVAGLQIGDPLALGPGRHAPEVCRDVFRPCGVHLDVVPVDKTIERTGRFKVLVCQAADQAVPLMVRNASKDRSKERGNQPVRHDARQVPDVHALCRQRLSNCCRGRLGVPDEVDARQYFCHLVLRAERQPVDAAGIPRGRKHPDGEPRQREDSLREAAIPELLKKRPKEQVLVRRCPVFKEPRERDEIEALRGRQDVAPSGRRAPFEGGRRR